MPQEDEQGLITPAIISPTRMLDGRMPALALHPRYAADCNDVRPDGGILKKRPGFTAFDVDISGNGGNLSGRVAGLSQTAFDWTDDIVALVQNGTYSTYYLYDTSEEEWIEVDQEAQTAYSQLSSCPAVLSDGTQIMILSDNKVRLKKWDDSETGVDKVKNHVADSGVYRAKVVRYYFDHLVMFNTAVYGGGEWVEGERVVQWFNTADCEDIDGGDAGVNYILGRTGGFIRGAEELMDDMIIYCEHEIISMKYVAGTSIFRFDPMVGQGLAAQNAILNLGDRHLFLADDYTVQEYCGGQYCRPIGDAINASIQSAINKTYAANSFFVNAKGLNEGWLFIPTTGATPDTVYVIKYGMCLEEFNWYKYTMSAFSAMVHDHWDVLTGYTNTINHYDYSATSDGGSAIDGWYETIDFTNLENPTQKLRHEGIRFEAKGNAGDVLTVQYSTDEGTSWSSVDTATLTAAWAFHELVYDSGYQRKIRYRFRNNVVDETFDLKWFQPVMLPGGDN